MLEVGDIYFYNYIIFYIFIKKNIMNLEIAKQNWYYEKGNLYWNRDIKKSNIKKGFLAGNKNSKKYLKVKLNGKEYYIHRIIFLLNYGFMPQYIDHINRNKLDNRIENLRQCTKAENNRNVSKWKKKELPKGVHLNGKNFSSQIMCNGIIYRLGTFKTIKEAELAYINKANELHKNFASY